MNSVRGYPATLVDSGKGEATVPESAAIMRLMNGCFRPILLKKPDFQITCTQARPPSENLLTPLSARTPVSLRCVWLHHERLHGQVFSQSLFIECLKILTHDAGAQGRIAL